jgi:hypothetical protein
MTVPHLFALAATGVAGGISSPDDIAGLEMWLDASDTGTITTGSGGTVVTGWVDKTGNGHNVGNGSGSSNRPQWNTRFLNGLNVIDFDRTQSDLLVGTSCPWYAAGTCTLFAVVEFDVVNQFGVIICEAKSTGAGATGEHKLLINNDTTIHQNNVSNAFVVEGDFGIAGPGTGNPTLIRFTDAGSGNPKTLALDNGTPVSDSYTLGTLTGLDRLAIGCRYDNNQDLFFDGAIAEILLYDSLLSSGDIALVEAYLNDKWGL